MSTSLMAGRKPCSNLVATCQRLFPTPTSTTYADVHRLPLKQAIRLLPADGVNFRFIPVTHNQANHPNTTDNPNQDDVKQTSVVVSRVHFSPNGTVRSMYGVVFYQGRIVPPRRLNQKQAPGEIEQGLWKWKNRRGWVCAGKYEGNITQEILERRKEDSPAFDG